MNDVEYKPTPKEVLNEIFRWKHKGNDEHSWLRPAITRVVNASGIFAYIQTLPYHIPTVAVGYSSESSDKAEDNKLESELDKKINRYYDNDSDKGFYGGLVLGGIGLVGQIIFYARMSYLHDFPYWAIPLGANAVSGIYELGNHVYKKAEQRLIDNYKPGKLEKKLENPVLEEEIIKNEDIVEVIEDE